jgi:hypothetical protein
MSDHLRRDVGGAEIAPDRQGPVAQSRANGLGSRHISHVDRDCGSALVEPRDSCAAQSAGRPRHDGDSSGEVLGGGGR